MNLQFTIRSLLILMAAACVCAWLFTFHWILGCVWLGITLGVCAGLRSNFPVPLMACCGLVLGLLLVVAFLFLPPAWNFNPTEQLKFNRIPKNTQILLLGLPVTLFALSIFICWWLVMALFRGKGKEIKAQRNQSRENLLAIIDDAKTKIAEQDGS